MDKASVSGAEDWGFESPLGCFLWNFGAAGFCHSLSWFPFCRSHSSSLAVEHRSYEPGVVGSIPTWSITAALVV